MALFNPKIFFSNDGLLMLDLLGNGNAVTLDDYMPQHLCLEAFDQTRFTAFWQEDFPLWLVDYRFCAQAQYGTQSKPIALNWHDYIHLDHYGLIEDGCVKPAELCQFMAVIGRYWDYQPVPALLYELYRAKPTHNMVAEILGQLADEELRIFDRSRIPHLEQKARQALISQHNKPRRRKTIRHKKRKRR